MRPSSSSAKNCEYIIDTLRDIIILAFRLDFDRFLGLFTAETNTITTTRIRDKQTSNETMKTFVLSVSEATDPGRASVRWLLRIGLSS